MHQRGDALRAFAWDGGLANSLSGSNEGFDVAAKLGNKRSARFSAAALKKTARKRKSAADGFFDDADALDAQRSRRKSVRHERRRGAVL